MGEGQGCIGNPAGRRQVQISSGELDLNRERAELEDPGGRAIAKEADEVQPGVLGEKSLPDT